MAQIFAVPADMHRRARQMALVPFRALSFHQAAVAHGHQTAVDLRRQALTSHLAYIGHAFSLNVALMRPHDRSRDRVRRKALHRGGKVQKLLLIDAVGVNSAHFKAALRQSAGLVKDQRVYLGKQLHIIGTLHQNALLGRAAQPAEEGQRHGNHQRAGAGDYQEVQRAFRPFRPRAAEEDRRNQEQQQGADDHAGSIHLGKAGNKALHLRLFGS